MPGERRRIHLQLSDDAIAGIDRLAGRHNITRVAMAEAIGQHWRLVELPPTVIDRARAIDRERRSRR